MLHEGVVKVCDFGWSVYKGGQLRTTFCGTPLYLSPEILVGDSYDESVDIWALGIMLYEMVLGSGPFKIACSEDLVKIIHDKIDLQDAPISHELKALIEACLKKTAADRPSARWLLNREWSKRGRPEECRRLNSNL
jgi:aurora kinase, other